ncbi:hypothetical protein [Enterococcus termitis]|uniref:Uncharacterized protein n=1 Tax=Enterococcus termitis TaxID=332950 RepID=A0A1E5H211_9ENTE|nr:hypothetical protein [Enterococcus termitis]OEG18670.1 hypothetical protein BCR25_15830 [Enterococcus termitis]OJG97607.1 hypothetical protein RV18_GL000675 [Enterococcus termitis]
MRTGKYGLKIEYKELTLDQVDSFIKNYPLEQLECKHICYIKDDLSTKIYREAISCGYEKVVLGSHRRATHSEEINRILEMATTKDFLRPVRVVMDKYGRFWCDNTHTTLAYILRGGQQLKDIPFYVVNLQSDSIISCDNTIAGDIQDLRNIYSSALRIQERINNGIRPNGVKWTISSLLKNMSMDKLKN